MSQSAIEAPPAQVAGGARRQQPEPGGADIVAAQAELAPSTLLLLEAFAGLVSHRRRRTGRGTPRYLAKPTARRDVRCGGTTVQEPEVTKDGQSSGPGSTAAVGIKDVAAASAPRTVT
ncbi:hypothetical protein SHIRM173S_06469 [Streptomyces hirsutus]